MAEMTKEEMMELQKMAGKAEDKPVTKLVQDVAKGLSELQQMLADSQGVTEKDNAQMQQIMDSFADLVEKKLAGAEPGQDVEEEEESLSQIPVDQGMGGKPMGPAQKN